MIAHAEGLQIGDQVKVGDRTGTIDLIVSDIIIIKWDWRKDYGAFTRDAVERRFSRHTPSPQH
jgi:hypothetical protein